MNYTVITETVDEVQFNTMAEVVNYLSKSESSNLCTVKFHFSEMTVSGSEFPKWKDWLECNFFSFYVDEGTVMAWKPDSSTGINIPSYFYDSMVFTDEWIVEKVEELVVPSGKRLYSFKKVN